MSTSSASSATSFTSITTPPGATPGTSASTPTSPSHGRIQPQSQSSTIQLNRPSQLQLSSHSNAVSQFAPPPQLQPHPHPHPPPSQLHPSMLSVPSSTVTTPTLSHSTPRSRRASGSQGEPGKVNKRTPSTWKEKKEDHNRARGSQISHMSTSSERWFTCCLWSYAWTMLHLYLFDVVRAIKFVFACLRCHKVGQPSARTAADSRAHWRALEPEGNEYHSLVAFFNLRQWLNAWQLLLSLLSVLPVELRPYASLYATPLGYPYFDPRQLVSWQGNITASEEPQFFRTVQLDHDVMR